jgi:hypothetical protein
VREYAKLSPTFWTGETGKEIKRRGIEAVVVAVYLLSSPHSNMLGLYYQPKLYLAHETGLGIEGASKGLQGCIEAGFCSFDEPSEMVWVFEMAAYQIAPSLSSGDKRCKGIQKDYDALPRCPHLAPFFDRYAAPFHLTKRRSTEPPKPESGQGACQAPSKPHRSQEQEQEQEQEVGASSKPLRPSRKCPAGFEVTTELREWAGSNTPGVDIDRETAKFRDHTFGTARSDWPGTWRNWMRKAHESRGGKPANGAGGDFFDGVQ